MLLACSLPATQSQNSSSLRQRRTSTSAFPVSSGKHGLSRLPALPGGLPFLSSVNPGAGSAFSLGTEAEFAAKHPFLAVDADRAVFLDFGLKHLLYQHANKAELIAKQETTAAAPTGTVQGQLLGAGSGLFKSSYTTEY